MLCGNNYTSALTHPSAEAWVSACGGRFDLHTFNYYLTDAEPSNPVHRPPPPYSGDCQQLDNKSLRFFWWVGGDGVPSKWSLPLGGWHKLSANVSSATVTSLEG